MGLEDVPLLRHAGGEQPGRIGKARAVRARNPFAPQRRAVKRLPRLRRGAGGLFQPDLHHGKAACSAQTGIL